jgi:hypothetical protein
VAKLLINEDPFNTERIWDDHAAGWSAMAVTLQPFIGSDLDGKA